MAIQNILIVDDDLSVRMSLKMILKGCGYTIDEAQDGEEAFHKLSENSYDLMFLDIIMPRMDGRELLARIEAQKIVLPYVIILSAYSNIEEVKATTPTANDYIAKPFNVSDIQQVLERMGQ